MELAMERIAVSDQVGDEVSDQDLHRSVHLTSGVHGDM
jgi:hypothetical protein